MNPKLAAAKTWIKDHKTALLTTALVATTTMLVVQQSGIQSLNQFLDEHDLKDKYYDMSDDVEN